MYILKEGVDKSITTCKKYYKISNTQYGAARLLLGKRNLEILGSPVGKGNNTRQLKWYKVDVFPVRSLNYKVGKNFSKKQQLWRKVCQSRSQEVVIQTH